MLGKIKAIIQFAPSKRCITIEVNGLTAKTYIVDNYANSKRWEKVKVGDSLSGLEWCDEEGKLIDADSKISVLK
jgi:hypothetical protein